MAKKKNTASPTSPRRRASADPQVLSYRHADRRRNNPEVGMVDPDTDPEQPKTRWAYDPHIDPALQFDVARGQIETLIDDALASGDETVMRRALEQLKRQAARYGCDAGPLCVAPRVDTFADSVDMLERLANFVSDVSVSRFDKHAVLVVLVDHFDTLAVELREHLKTEFYVSEGVDTFLSEPGFSLTRLRLGQALGLVDAADVFRELLRLASSTEPESRGLAAQALVHLSTDDSAVLSVGLMLSRDVDSGVRAKACYSLLTRSWKTQTDWDGLVWPRVVEMLEEGGRLPPLGVLSGLFRGARIHTGRVPQRVTSTVQILAREHPSWRVRERAERVLERWLHPDAAPISGVG